MPINIGDNFSYLGKKFLDNRESFDTFEAMNSCTDVPIGFITYCIEDKKRYEYTEFGWVEYVVTGGGSGGSIKEVEMSDRQPTDRNVLMWINTSEDAQTEIIAKINDQMVSKDATWSSEKINDIMKDVNIDVSQENIIYVGDIEPTDTNVLWFDTNDVYNITEENSLITELKNLISYLNNRIVELEERVTYLELNGGGNGGNGGGTINPPIEDTTSYVLLEDGSELLLEDGDNLLLEQNINIISDNCVLLEDGSELLLEDGDNLLLEVM